ncbi:YggS family pyridoxal phosphate-dependent enzyme [Peptacetobacter hominis]|uniref:Pyridoxal phosphate homeostasis protein n=1 Tax=Peptacetobacter hominis TaxID=2743610 RepID=A0A544QUT6_9FIRM|nr:YggS family pyridoxal phosphate-dependent enzyme [Peptacetobacter hominis]TQQ84453.1 YggS family pyridoxal phosphate-dependent enzyme [Peptacetobacter hominis]
MGTIKENLYEINKRIKASAEKAGRNYNDIKLIAVTKTVDTDRVEEAIEAGIESAGENKPQELSRKYEILGDAVKWHQIGTLQKNKVKYIIDKACMIHSIESISLAEEINKRAQSKDIKMDCLVQVNISGEESKHGVSPEEAMSIIKYISENCQYVKIKGLMTMAPFDASEDEIRRVFRGLKELSEKIDNENIENVEMKELSMGMTNDFEIAIEEGATMVRIGTAIFGKRDYDKKQ